MDSIAFGDRRSGSSPSCSTESHHDRKRGRSSLFSRVDRSKPTVCLVVPVFALAEPVSTCPMAHGDVSSRSILSEWSLPRFSNWADYVHLPQSDTELEAIRHSVKRVTPCGTESLWHRDVKTQVARGEADAVRSSRYGRRDVAVRLRCGNAAGNVPGRPTSCRDLRRRRGARTPSSCADAI